MPVKKYHFILFTLYSTCFKDKIAIFWPFLTLFIKSLKVIFIYSIYVLKISNKVAFLLYLVSRCKKITLDISSFNLFLTGICCSSPANRGKMWRKIYFVSCLQTSIYDILYKVSLPLRVLKTVWFRLILGPKNYISTMYFSLFVPSDPPKGVPCCFWCQIV